MFDEDLAKPEFARDDLEPDYVQRRLDDWRRRVEDLMDDLEGWAREAGLKVERSQPIRRQERPIEKYGLSAVDLPTLRITAPDGRVSSVEPKALWIIGGNGAVDIITTRGVYNIVDIAEPLAQPNWWIVGPTLRGAPQLSRDRFLLAVR